jgi:hypothetical protein
LTPLGERLNVVLDAIETLQADVDHGLDSPKATRG